MTVLTLSKPGTLALVALAFCMENSAAQTSVTIGALKDNSLYENITGSTSNGAGMHMFVGKTNDDMIRRALLAFDIATNVPAGSVIDSVKLTLKFNKTIVGDQPVELHKVLADWGEGTTNATGQEGMGAASTTGSATWIHTFFSTSFWTTPGGDFSATVSGSKMIGDATQVGLQTWNSTPGMVADIQDWLDNPSTNFGWVLVGNESTFPTTKRFSTREDPVVGNRPSMTIFFHQPIPCGDITSIGTRCIGGGTKTIQVRVNLLNNIIHAGEPVTITIDGSPFTATIISNGIHSRANFSVAGWSVGTHTVSLVDPPGCLADKHPECATFARIDPEWDDIDWTAPAGNVPQTTELLGNYPNPFNPSTTIRYSLSHDAWVTLRIYNTIGQVIATLADQFEEAGYKSVVWDGKNSAGEEVAAGVYMYMIKAGELVRVDRMIVVK